MATTAMLARSWPALSEHKRLRFATLFLLYAAQGLPIGFFGFALPAWLAANGASAAEVGSVVAAGSLPWSLKLVHGFVMDRWSYLPMGRRRGWLIGAQLMIVLSLLALALAGAQASDVLLLSAFAFVVNLFVTLQDVAIDGMAIDLIPDEERGRANGFMFGGQAIGMAAGTALGGLLLTSGGMGLAAIVQAALVAALLLMIVILRERPGEKLLPWSPGQASAEALDRQCAAWGPLFASVLRATANAPALMFLAAAFLAGTSGGLFIGLASLLGSRELGWPADRVSNLLAAGSIAGALLALLLFGRITDRIGAKRMVMLAGALTLLSAATMLAARDLWHVPAVFIALALATLALDVAIRTGSCAIAMRLCLPAVGATQFALFMAAANLGIGAGGALLGTVDRLGGLPAMLLAMCGAQGAALLLFALARLGR